VEGPRTIRMHQTEAEETKDFLHKMIFLTKTANKVWL